LDQSLHHLHEEIRLFPAWLRELHDIESDAYSSQYTRPPSDTPFVSGGWRVNSPVERIVINVLCKDHVVQLATIVRACLALYLACQNKDKVVLVQLWRGKHHDMLPEDVLLRYEVLKSQTIPNDTVLEEMEATWLES